MKKTIKAPQSPALDSSLAGEGGRGEKALLLAFSWGQSDRSVFFGM